MSASHNISRLASLLAKYRDAYYNGTPQVSDAQYDMLEDELRKLDPNHPALTRVGTTPTSKGWVKVKHEIPMGSQNKAQEAADMVTWLKSIGYKDGNALIIMDKLDGISLSLKYKSRKLVQALTRGDGETGEDITRNVLLMQGAVKMLPAQLSGQPTPDTVYVRAEIVCKKSDFKAHFPGESNPRNTAAGTAKRQSDNSKCAHLTVITYQLLPEGRPMPTKAMELKVLEQAGFNVALWACVNNTKGVAVRYDTYVAKTRDSLDYDIDGLIVEVDDESDRSSLGELNHRPKGSIAYKFPHEEKKTVLRHIRWQVGNSGRVTPVAEFDAVNLGGAQVKQASLHNISNILRLLADAGIQSVLPNGNPVLHAGMGILVAKRGDVIPYMEAILSAIPGDQTVQFLAVPSKCPECGTPLERDGEYLVCRNIDCGAQVAGMLKRWVKKIGVLHVGDTFIEAMIEAFPFVLTDEEFEARYQSKPDAVTPAQRVALLKETMDIADLYLLDPKKAEEVVYNGRRLGGSATKAIRNLNKKKALPLHVFIGALGIPLIGRSMAKIIIDSGYGSLSALYKVGISAVGSIPKIGDTKAESFVLGYQAKIGLVSKLISDGGITVQDSNGPLVGKSFCLTGFRDNDLSEALERAGGTVKSSVSKGLTYLVALDPSSNTGKMQKAKSYGTDVISPGHARKLAGL